MRKEQKVKQSPAGGFRLTLLAVLMAASLALLPTLSSVLAAAGDTERVSVDSSGIQGNIASRDPSISGDGSTVAFSSYASNLVGGDTNSGQDIFVHDRTTGVTERVSVDSSGTQGNNHSYVPSISNNDRYVAFESLADNLVLGDTNLDPDIFVHDRTSGLTERVSIDSVGTQANNRSYQPSISADGRYVAFRSAANNLVAGDTNGSEDIFVHDRDTGITERVSVDSSGTQGNGSSFIPSISSDGRYVAFESDASNLVAGDTTGQRDIFVHDRDTGITERVSVDSSGTQGDGYSAFPSISSDGRYVVFDSVATNLVAGDINGTADVFVHDRDTGDTERVSVDSSGTPGTAASNEPSISGDGRYVAFRSDSNNLVAGDTNGLRDIFVHDRDADITERVSVDSSGTEGNGASNGNSISIDGRYVSFDSLASNLVTGDTNGGADVFVHDLLGDPVTPTPLPSNTPTTTPTPTPTATPGPTHTPAPSEGGSASKPLAGSGSTSLQFGRIIVTVPEGAVPAGETNCRIVVQTKGDSGQYGFSLDDTVWDVKIVCDSGEVNLFFAPISICIRPKDGVVADKQVFHNHGGGFGPLAVSGGASGYVCGETRQLSLFTLGEFVLPSTGFAPGAETILGEQPADLAYTASDLILNIPTLNVQLDIVGVPQSPNGWDVSWLASSQAGYLYGTTFPTWAGNSVLTAHVWNADNTAGPFYGLKALQSGDQFSVVAWGRTYTYEVRSNALVSEHGISVLADSSYAMITLVTCEGFNEASGDYIYRRAVQAVLVSVD